MFNSEGVTNSTVQKLELQMDANISHYFVEGEVLTWAQNGANMPVQATFSHELPAEYVPTAFIIGLPVRIYQSVNNHSMSVVIGKLKKSGLMK